MKKTTSIILSLVLLFTAIGCDEVFLQKKEKTNASKNPVVKSVDPITNKLVSALQKLNNLAQQKSEKYKKDKLPEVQKNKEPQEACVPLVDFNRLKNELEIKDDEISILKEKLKSYETKDEVLLKTNSELSNLKTQKSNLESKLKANQSKIQKLLKKVEDKWSGIIVISATDCLPCQRLKYDLEQDAKKNPDRPWRFGQSPNDHIFIIEFASIRSAGIPMPYIMVMENGMVVKYYTGYTGLSNLLKDHPSLKPETPL